MLGLLQSTSIYLHKEPCDMRKGFDSLRRLVEEQGQSVYHGSLFLFLSKKKTHLKILTFQTGGFVLLYKRLEKGCFKLPCFEREQSTMRLESSQLALLLDGYDIQPLKAPQRWFPEEKRSAKVNQL